MPLVGHVRHIGFPSAFEVGKGGRSPFLIFSLTLRLFSVRLLTYIVLIMLSRTLWKSLLYSPLPYPTVPFPLKLIRVLSYISHRSPIFKPVINNRVKGVVPCVLVLSSESTWAWDRPARQRTPSLRKTVILWDTAGSHSSPAESCRLAH